MATFSDSLVANATALIPLLRKAAPAAEKARRVPQESLDALSAAGIFRMTAPKAYGGVEADFQTQCEVLAEIARGCPSTSWVATIYSAMSWLVGVFPDETQEEIYANGDPRISRRVLADRHRGAQGRRLRRQRAMAVQHRLSRRDVDGARTCSSARCRRA